MLTFTPLRLYDKMWKAVAYFAVLLNKYYLNKIY